MYEYHAKLDRVVDGDTVDLHVDLGFDVSKKLRFRLTGIDAPEPHTETREEGIAATAYLYELLDGKELKVKTTKDSRGSFGRYLCEIIAYDERNHGRSANQAMVDAGHAVLSQA